MKNKFKYTILLLVAALHGTAQDFHLSQYDMAPQYMNPALTGMYCGVNADYRIYITYRTQWASPSVKPYSTAFLAFDMTDIKWKRDFGLGGYIIDNSAGAGSMKTFSFMISGAYNITGSSNGIHYLTTGLQMGLLHKDFDPTNYTYDQQYSESMGGFDPGIPSGENFAKNSLNGFDVNYGIFYKYTETGKRAHPFGGLSIYHVTQPNESFTGTEVKTPMRFNFQAGCDIQMNDVLKLNPRFLYMNEAHAHEFNIGFVSYYKIKDTPYETILQCDYRNKDALVLGLGLKQGDHIFRMSYDIGTSSLSPYLGGRGSWEFSIILTGKKGRPLFNRTSNGVR